jgi:chemotaxis protein MotB
VQIASFEEQVASLLAERDAARAEGAALAADLEELRGENAELISEQEALQLALAQRTRRDRRTDRGRAAGRCTARGANGADRGSSQPRGRRATARSPMRWRGWMIGPQRLRS